MRQVHRHAHGAPGVPGQRYGPHAAIDFLVAEHGRCTVGDETGEILAREPLRAGHAPQREQIVAQQAAFFRDAAAQLILMNNDAGIGAGEHRNIAGVIGVKMRDDEVGEIRRLHVDLRETLRKQSVRPGIVDHSFLVEIVLPVLAEGIAHARVDEYRGGVVLDHVSVNGVGDLAVRARLVGARHEVSHHRRIGMAGENQFEIERSVAAGEDDELLGWHRNCPGYFAALRCGCSSIRPMRTPPVLFGCMKACRPRESLNVWPTSCPPAAVICAHASSRLST